MSYWLVIGPPDNWTFCFNNGNVWGFSPSYQRIWQSLAQGDTVLCYATRPVMGLIGYCSVRSKQEDENPFFPQEQRERKALWPLRLILSPGRIIPRDRWDTSRILLERRGVTLQRALQKLPDDRAKNIIQELDKLP